MLRAVSSEQLVVSSFLIKIESESATLNSP